MTPFQVIPIANVNLRSGPGISYDVVDQMPSGINLTASELRKDGAGVAWYKVTEDGWVNSNYVKQPNQLDNLQNNPVNLASEIVNSNARGVIDQLQSSIVDAANTIFGSGATGGIIGNTNSTLLGTLTNLAVDTQDLMMKRRIFATPFQFIESTDMRPSKAGSSKETSPLGVEFASNIMSETPILSLLPGIPNFLTDMTPDEREQMLKGLVNTLTSQVESMKNMTQEILSDKNLDTKFFEFTSRTSEYMLYVNVMCRMCAIYIGIGDKLVPGTSIKYSEYNWFNWHLSNAYANEETQVEGISAIGDSISNLATGKGFQTDETLKKMADAQKQAELASGDKVAGYDKVAQSTNSITKVNNNAYFLDQYYIDFFIKPPSYSEGFSNQTSESMLAGAMSQGSNVQKELAFLFASAGGETKGFSESVENYEKAMDQYIKKTFQNAGVQKAMSRLITGSTAVITGSNLIFPEVWQSSDYDRNFQVEITLSTPYGDKESIFLEILVPMMHLLAFVLPRQSSVNSYTSPFLVRANVPGFFSCDMGIVRDLQITKGGSAGDCWTVDGLPTEVNISMSISDLYKSMSMSNFKTPRNAWNFMYNTPFLDYIGIQCGLDMKSSEYSKKIDLIKSLTSNVVSDQVDYTLTSMRETAAQNKLKIMAGK